MNRSTAGPPGPGGRTVLGLGGCVDWELTWDAAVLQRLVDRHQITLAQLDRSVPVTDEPTLLRSLLAFLREGAGGERFIASPELVMSFAMHFPRTSALGGTNVRAARAMSRLGLRSSLHLVSVDDTVRRLLPPGTDYICSAEQDRTWPHLIVQFPAGAQVRVNETVLRAPHPNRLIYVNDPLNRHLSLSPDLGHLLRGAATFLISGFNSMQDTAALDVRLSDLHHHAHHLPAHAVVVFEDADYHIPQMRYRVLSGLHDLVTIHSMNADELQTYVGRRVELLDAVDLAAALREVRSLLSARTLVVHTQYWGLAFGQDAARYQPALESAMRTAAARYLHGDSFTRTDHDAVTRHGSHPGGLAVARRLPHLLPGQVCCIPALTPTTGTPTTVGLGDAFIGGFLAGFQPT